MSIFNNRRIVFALKLYLCAVLITAAILSSAVTSVAAILVLVVYLFLQWRPMSVYTGLVVNYFIFFTIAILLAPITNFVLSTLIGLPILFLVTNSLINAAGFFPRIITRYSRSLTRIGMMLPALALVNLIIALFLGNFALALASSAAVIYLSVLGVVSIIKLSGKSIVLEQIEEHIIAGTTAELKVNVHPQTKLGGILYVESLYAWTKIQTPVLLFKQAPLILSLSVNPLLSGPSEVSVKSCLVDCWGLTQVQFQVVPIKLQVIPRARYATWLAKRYMDATKPGMLPIISNVSTVRPQYGFRRGIEYYGSQLYQPGDELKSIDWKHSAKYNKMITKEFVEFHGQPAILLVNLAVGNVEEADELAQNTIITAISLAREQIPTVIAAYDQDGVKLVTPTLQPLQLVVQSLEITKEITIFANPTRYLYGPDISRLRANIGRLESVEGESSKVLSQLMNIEYASFMTGVAHNPATQAINKALMNANIQSTMVIVSKLNHDANAIEVNRFLLKKKGYAIIAV
jgi:hypothetical protein